MCSWLEAVDIKLKNRGGRRWSDKVRMRSGRFGKGKDQGGVVMRNSVVAVWTLGMILFVMMVHGFYPCPYSGPADNPNETNFQVDEYIIRVEVTFPDDTHEGLVTGWVSMQCVSLVDALDRIDLDFYSSEKAMITRVARDSVETGFLFDADIIEIPLATTLDTGETVQVDVEYQVEGNDHFKFVPKPPKTVLFAYNSMVEASRWFPCLHDPSDKAWYQFQVRTLASLVSACNGTLQSDVDNGDGTHTMTWIEHEPMSTYLATVNVSEYVTFEHDWESIPVIYYVRSESLADAQIDFQNDDAILDFFDEAFGPYPFEKMGLAQVRLAGAMENQDMISYGLISGDLSNEDTFAHEISHMYWGDSVTLRGCEDVWLNEGFASYCEALWEEHFYGDAAYDAVMADFRSRYFAEDAVHRFSIYDPEDVWSNTTYRKGAWVLHMLRRVVGDPDFLAILPEYYDRYQFSHATTPDFISVCEEVSGLELDWFFDEWIYEAGYPEFQVCSRYKDNQMQIYIEQQQDNAPVFRMPAVIQLDYGTSGTVENDILIDSAVKFFSYSVASQPEGLVLDPENSILCTTEYSQQLPSTRCVIEMPATVFKTGDTCWCRVHVDNYDWQPLTEYPLFVILDVFGELFFAPSFSDFDSYLALYPTFLPGRTTIDVLPEFSWPPNTGTISGIQWYAGLTDPKMTTLHGEIGMFTFGWEE